MFRFTIRELALLTVIVGLAAGWWIDRSRQVARYDRLKFAVEHYAEIGFDSTGELHPSWYPRKSD
jgi:hypothetical protein